MGRKKSNSVTVSYRLGVSTFQQLKAEAKVAKMPVGTYIRRLLQNYAPGTDGPEAPEKATKLSEAAAALSEL
ncbi:MAG: hypothetical protein WCA44_05955 [Acidobacteriaceae bacterium]